MRAVMVVTSTAEERARRYREYVEALEEERRKIQVFHRELPISLHLVTQTIENCRQAMAAELMTAGASGDPSELDEEETSSEGAPVLEQFIPIKHSCSTEADDEEGDRRHHRGPSQDDGKGSNGHHHEDDCYSTSKPKQVVKPEKKPDWLRSVQLWSQQPDPQPARTEEDDEAPPRPIVVEAKKPTGAFQPFNPQRRSPALAAAPAEISPVAAAAAPSVPPASSSSETGGAEKGGAGVADEKDGNPHRKARRCWSPELHKRFLDALHRLGGSHAATPKQIRELMKVDGLTNDEVKSHLQKYRLHSRRPSPTSQSSAGNPRPQQVVFVGGIWVPPPEYAAAAAAAAAGHPPAEGVVASPLYAPIASVPTPAQQQVMAKLGHRSPTGPLPTGGSGSRVEQGSADDDATRSNSPATSSSSHATTTSPSPRCL